MSLQLKLARRKLLKEKSSVGIPVASTYSEVIRNKGCECPKGSSKMSPDEIPGQDVTLPPLNFHLDYLGGPVISNAQVVSVLWGSNVDAPIIEMIPDFIGSILQSKYIDSLIEYSTLGLPAPTTNQIIGRGTFVGQKTIIPFNTSNPINDSFGEISDLQTEIINQINAGNLPPPEYDDQ